jgi:hypothetical protein
MNIFRSLRLCLLMLSGICCLPPVFAEVSAQPVNIRPAVVQVFKGELQVSVPAQQRDSLLIRYRAKNKEVVRIGISELKLTNTRTQEVILPGDRAAGFSNQVDQGGYWIIDIPYHGLKLGDDNYRVEGNFTQYLRASQRSHDFSVYLQSETASKPVDSTIDWSVDN